ANGARLGVEVERLASFSARQHVPRPLLELVHRFHLAALVNIPSQVIDAFEQSSPAVQALQRNARGQGEIGHLERPVPGWIGNRFKRIAYAPPVSRPS